MSPGFMKRLLVIILLGVACGSFAAEQKQTLATPLEPFRNILGKTWKGHFKRSTPEKPLIDVARWERTLNGQAVRILHSVNNGAYGGESIMMANPKTEQVEFYYFTTAGFLTRGTVRFDGGKILTHEDVIGSKEGITEVKAATELLPDGKLHVKSEYLKNGEWVPGREITYEEAPDAQVVFK
jgi:hypothetical protein